MGRWGEIRIPELCGNKEAGYTRLAPKLRYTVHQAVRLVQENK